MAYPLSLPMTAVLAIAGAGLGVHLGRDSAAQIDPSFYDSTAPSTFYASLVPNPPSFDVGGLTPPQHPDAIVLDESGSCASCGLDAQAVYMPDRSDYDGAYAEWNEPASDEVAQAARMVEAVSAAPAPAEGELELERNAAMAQIERYASYPVTSDMVEPGVEADIVYAEME